MAVENRPLGLNASPSADPPVSNAMMGHNDQTLAGFHQTDPDEAAILYILRILNRASRPRPLTPVEHAFVVGARAMFRQLVEVCDDLIKKDPKSLGKFIADASDKPKGAGLDKKSAQANA